MEEDEVPLLAQQADENIFEQKIDFPVWSDDGNMVLTGYKKCMKRTILTWIGTVLSVGFLFLLFHWQPRWKLICTHVKCSLETATRLLILETFQTKYRTYHVKNVSILDVNSPDELGLNHQSDGYNENVPDTKSTCTVYLEDGSSKEVANFRGFRCKKLLFIWMEDKKCFLKMVGLERSLMCTQFHTAPGNSADQQKILRGAYGENEIQVPVQSIAKLIVLEFFNPFYVFQVFTIAVWIAEQYYYYCIAIAIMSVFGITTTVIQTRRNQINLKSTVQSIGDVQVCRDRLRGTYEEICSSDLVPGDIILIPSKGCTMHVDAVLLDGSCIVNESMLTGESVPVTKTALPNHNRLYDMKNDTNHTLYCGTKVIQTRYYKNEAVRAVVLRTGFLTTKGQLVRSIMYPLPADFKFDRDSYKFIIILTFIAALGLIYTVTVKAGRDITAGDIVLKSLDIITIVIPPALPAAMTVGRLYAISRLKAAGVFCINPRTINVCGSISCVCFDKTGTLTEDGLDMWGVVPATISQLNKSTDMSRERKKSSNSNADNNEIQLNQNIEPMDVTRQSNSNKKMLNVYAVDIEPGTNVSFEDPIRDPSTLDDSDLIKIGMNVCHSLTILDDEITGDPLDVKMFESTGWILEEPKVPDDTKYDLLVPTVVRSPLRNGDTMSKQEWGILQQYQFSSSLQRCSVICKSIHSTEYMTFCKGSPEMIVALSQPETVPLDIKTCLRHYTRQGYRVLALGCRRLPEESFLKIQRLTRDQVETDLVFLGLVVMENRLKPESEPVIKELHEANIKIVMITGDNLDTAVSVAAECGLLIKGEKLILCEAVPSEIKDAPPDLYYTSSMINIEGLKQSKTNSTNVPTLTRISAKDITNLNNSSDATLCSPSVSTSSLSLNYLENGISKYKIAMIGATWKILKEHYQPIIPKLITRGAIFARMSSEQKQQLVQELQALGYYVAMSGDGANDCGALKTAHVGISVSGEESSVASPFTSREGHVGCVPLVIREGRAALTTSFGMFKFMIGYSMTEFISVAMLYYFDSNLTDFQFLYIDIFLILFFAFFFGKTHAYPGPLCKKPPGTSLLGFVPLFSLTMQVIIAMIVQIGCYFILTTFDWYSPHVRVSENFYFSYENYGIFCVSMFQYITIAIVFSRGKPYRKIIFTNWIFMLVLIVMTIISAYIVVYPAEWLESLLELRMPPGYEYRYIILILGFINFIVALFVEKVIVQFMMQEKEFIPKRLTENFPKSNSYHSIEKDLQVDSNWPPVSSNEANNALNEPDKSKTNGILKNNVENCNGKMHDN